VLHELVAVADDKGRGLEVDVHHEFMNHGQRIPTRPASDQRPLSALGSEMCAV
jgi:hypothetical protein